MAERTKHGAKTIRIAAAQTVEFRDNLNAALACLVDVANRASAADAKLLCLPECFLQGYLTESASAHQAAINLDSAEFAGLLRRFPTSGPAMVVGMIERHNHRLYNTAIVVYNRSLIGLYRKRRLLPGEGVFDCGSDTPVFEIEGLKFGINICNDTNYPEEAQRIVERRASLIVCPTNNMMPRNRAEQFADVHNRVRGDRCRETGLWLISADVTGERDGRLAIGPTAVLDPQGHVVKQLPIGEPGLLLVDLPLPAPDPDDL